MPSRALAGIRERYGEAVYLKIDWRPKEPYHLFSIDIESAAYIVYDNDKQSVKTWP